MNNTRRVFVCLLGLVVILSILVFPVSAQGNDTGAGKSEEDYLLQSQRNFDNSLSILNTIATLIAIMVAILAIFIAAAAYLGFSEIKNWLKIRKDVEKKAENLTELINRTESELGELRKEIPENLITEKPAPEVLDKLDEYSHRLETLELLGASLKPEDYTNMGNNFFFKEEYGSALKAFNKAIELKSDDAHTWSNKASTLSKLGQHRDALVAYGKLIELESDYAYSWFYRARAYALLGNKENALSDLKTAIELDVSYKEEAKKDEDLKTLWEDEDFKKLVE